jgi:hypothetical protein
MLWSAVAYTGYGALFGIAVIALGLPVWRRTLRVVATDPPVQAVPSRRPAD